jgi:tripartite motif-containing protein 71
MVSVKRVIFAGLAVSAFLALAGCPSPFLAAIKDQIARYPFASTSYKFLRQWGNAHPEWAFNSPIVRTGVAGSVYVADYSFRVRKFDPSGTLQAFFNVAMPSFIFSSLFDMAVDPSDNVFVATGSCFFGCSGEHVQKYDGSGNPVGAAWGTFGGGTLTLTTDGSGNVYVVDSANNNIQKFDSSGTYIATFTTTAPALSSPNGITFDGTNLEITDTVNNRVVVMSTSGSVVTSWSSTSGTVTALSAPSGIGYDFSNHVVYVVDRSNSRIVAANTSGGYVATFGGVGTANGQFTTPTSVAVDAATNIYVTDTGASVNGTARVQKFTQGTPPAYAASWVETSSAGGNGVFSNPEAVAFDSSGNVYVADVLNNRIQQFDPSGTFIRQWGTWGAAQPFGFTTGGCYGIAVDSSGKVYVSDGGNSQVEEFNSSGGFIKVIGNGVIGTPRGVGVDSSGNVYIADGTNYHVQVFSPNAVHIGTWGSQGTGNGQFESPYGLAVDGSGNVWVTDSSNNNVQEFDSQGHFVRGLGGATYGSGPGQFLYPVAVAADHVGGFLYVVDFGNRRIQKFDSSGNYLTQLDSSGTPNGFSWPFACAIDSSGNVILGDYQDGTVIEYAPVLK